MATPLPQFQPTVVKLHCDGPTGYVNSGKFDTVVENNFSGATQIVHACYFKGIKVLRSHLSIYGKKQWILLQARVIMRDIFLKLLMLMTHENIFVKEFLRKAWQKDGIKRLILNTGKFTFPNRRELLCQEKHSSQRHHKNLFILHRIA